MLMPWAFVGAGAVNCKVQLYSQLQPGAAHAQRCEAMRPEKFAFPTAEYGHLAPSYITDAIRAGAPRFGFVPDAKLVVMP
jgi:hypothetical protein